MSTHDRREPVRLDVTLKYDTEGEFVRGFACNVSTRAIFLKTQSPKPVGTPVRVQLKLRSGEVMLAGEGRVLWSYESPLVPLGRQTGMGIQFESDDADSSDRVNKMVQIEDSGRYASAPGVRLLDRLSADDHASASEPPTLGPDPARADEVDKEGLTADWVASSEFELVPTGHEGPADPDAAQAKDDSIPLPDTELPSVDSVGLQPPALPDQDVNSPAFEAAISEAFDVAPTVPMSTAQPSWLESSAPLIDASPGPGDDELQDPDSDDEAVDDRPQNAGPAEQEAPSRPPEPIAEPPHAEATAPVAEPWPAPPPLRPQEREAAGLQAELPRPARPDTQLHGRILLEGVPPERPAPALAVRYWIVGGSFDEPPPAHSFEWPEEGTKRPISKTPPMLDDDLWTKLTGSASLGDWTSEDPFASPGAGPKDGELDIPLRSIAVANNIAATDSASSLDEDDRGFDDVFASSDPELETAETAPRPAPHADVRAASADDTDASLEVDWSKEVFSSVESEGDETARDRRPYVTPSICSQPADQIAEHADADPAQAEKPTQDPPPDVEPHGGPPRPAETVLFTAAKNGSDDERRAGAETGPVSLSSAVGIALPGGRVRVLLESGTRAPQVFHRSLTVPRGGARLELDLVQGDDEHLDQCSPLARVVIEGADGKTVERDSFDVCIRLCEDGVLEVEARDSSGALVASERVATLDATASGRRRAAARPQTTGVIDSDDGGGILAKIKSRFLRGRT